MPAPLTPERADAARWTRGVLAVFTLLGFGFGSWLSRLPATRDHLGASTLEMSVLGFILAGGSVLGLLVSGRSVAGLGPRRALAIGVLVQFVAMPAAALLLWFGLPVPGAACLAVYGFAFSTCDVAMNVSGANAERALGKPRMPLLHAGYSLGSVAAMGVGALAEVLRVPVPVHLGIGYILIAAGALLALRAVPREDGAPRAARPVPTRTGSIPIPSAASADAERSAASEASEGDAPRRGRSPWRDPRVLAIGLIAMTMALAEGTASDWLSLALADGRGLPNADATLVLGGFFVAMMLTRIAGSWLLTRFGRVLVLRAGSALVVLGVAAVILVDAPWTAVLGAILWGVGAALGFPIGISAAADDPARAVRNVAAVSAIAYTALLLGPMVIGFLGEHLGLLTAFWPIAGFALLPLILARSAEPPAPAKEPA
ncbi:MFS transporter [Leucobacter allii]|uniref:MFS transporter n=1 Tax=Leucobacter allii TaxID=2932247 RepID=A0ABY4FLR2_9MICO|nr:MFS transporter [Leucobacter allii]UOQ57186.1 MFS transporter [Leucobacter allii]